MEVLDLASILGLVLCIIFVFLGIIIGEDSISVVKGFIDYPSIMITFGGSFAAVLAMTGSLNEFVNNLKSVSLIMKTPKSNEIETIKNIIDLSNTARKEGLLALEEAANNIDDPFLKKGVLLIVDGTDPELVRSILETELISIEGRHKNVIGFWDNVAAMGPAWGMIGTLIGLIKMLKDLNDPSTIGPSMAVALVTTFYGSMLANWIATPISTKLKGINDNEIMMKEVIVEGLLSIQAGENPRVIEEKLKSFLAPSRRADISEEGGEING